MTVTSFLFVFTRWTMVLTAVYRILPATDKVGVFCVVCRTKRLIDNLIADVRLSILAISPVLIFDVAARLRPSFTTFHYSS